MTDRELLEMAAKAVGINHLKLLEIKNVRHEGDDRFIGFMTDPDEWDRGWFNPLEDDGDAFQMMVKLKLLVDVCDNGSAEVVHDSLYFISESSTDAEANARRAIVRAAAAMGEQSWHY